MKIAVLGGTGKMGGAVARHLAKKNDVAIGSRDPAKATEAAKAIPGAGGGTYESAAQECDVVVVAVPYSAIGSLSGLAETLTGKLVVSIVNALVLQDGILRYPLEKGSAAEQLAAMFPQSSVATAFNNVPIAMMSAEEVASADILVAASDKDAYEKTAELVRGVPKLRPLYAGPLSEASVVERITPLVLNLRKWNGTGSLTTKFVSKSG